MMGLTRDELLGAVDTEAVVLRNGKTVHVREMGLSERDDFEIAIASKESKKDKYAHLRGFRAALLVRTLCDEAGKPLFEAGDEAELANAPAGLLDAAFAVAKRLNGFTDDDVEELVGN